MLKILSGQDIYTRAVLFGHPNPGQDYTEKEGEGVKYHIADPNDFGIFDMRGLWFVWGNLVRDIAALNRMELLLPWDSWGLAEGQDQDPTSDDVQL